MNHFPCVVQKKGLTTLLLFIVFYEGDCFIDCIVPCINCCFYVTTLLIKRKNIKHFYWK